MAGVQWYIGSGTRVACRCRAFLSVEPAGSGVRAAEMASVASRDVAVLLLLLLLGTARSAPQHRLLFSPSLQSSTVRPLLSRGSPAPGSSEDTSLSAGTDPVLASSGRLIFTPQRLVFSASRRSGPSLFAAVPPPAADGMTVRLQTLLQRLRLAQAAGRSRQTQWAAAARHIARSGPRPRLGLRTPEAVAANPEAATAPRDGVTRGAVKAGTGDPLADHTAAADAERLERLDAKSEASDWASNLLDSAARAGLRSPGQALDGPDTPDSDRLWPAVQTADGRVGHAESEEAEDRVYSSALRSEELFSPGAARSDDPDCTASPRPIPASAQLLEKPDTELRQPPYLAELVRLGGDFVHLPGLRGLPAGHTADTGPAEQSASPMYVYIVRGDGQTLDLYATDGRPPVRTAGDDATAVPSPAAAVIEGGIGRKASQEPNDRMPVNQNKIGGGTTGLNSVAESLANLLRAVGETKDLNMTSRGRSANSEARKSPLPAPNGTEHTITNEKYKDPNASVYFDPVDELIPRPEAKSKPFVENAIANIAIGRKQDNGIAVDEPLPIAEDRGIFFFPGNVIQSFGIAPSATGKSLLG